MNLFTCVWNPVMSALIHNEALRNTVSSIVTTVVTGVFFASIFLSNCQENIKKKATHAAPEYGILLAAGISPGGG